MNVMLIIKYSSTVMQGKRKLCECHTRFLKYDVFMSQKHLQVDMLYIFTRRIKNNKSSIQVAS